MSCDLLTDTLSMATNKESNSELINRLLNETFENIVPPSEGLEKQQLSDYFLDEEIKMRCVSNERSLNEFCADYRACYHKLRFVHSYSSFLLNINGKRLFFPRNWNLFKSFDASHRKEALLRLCPESAIYKVFAALIPRKDDFFFYYCSPDLYLIEALKGLSDFSVEVLALKLKGGGSG